MADRCQAPITIGGTLPASLLDAFIETIRDEGLSTEWDCTGFDASDLPENDALRLMANEVAWGRFDDLEAFCIVHRLPFARWSGACLGAFDAVRVVFTGGGDLQYYAASDDDNVLIGRHTAETLGSYEAIIANFDAADFLVPPLRLTG